MKPTIGFLRPASRFVGEELRGFFLGRAADLADHDDRLGRVVGEEQSSTSMKLVPLTGSPPMPTAVVWPRPSLVVWNTAS
jgi:hypothetical protein